jgi:hypothetical protein
MTVVAEGWRLSGSVAEGVAHNAVSYNILLSI